jgi:hypothetical protein
MRGSDAEVRAVEGFDVADQVAVAAPSEAGVGCSFDGWVRFGSADVVDACGLGPGGGAPLFVAEAVEVDPDGVCVDGVSLRGEIRVAELGPMLCTFEASAAECEAEHVLLTGISGRGPAAPPAEWQLWGVLTEPGVLAVDFHRGCGEVCSP